MVSVVSRVVSAASVIIVLFIAAFVRLRLLGAASFWFDEVFTANLVTFKTSISSVIDAVARTDAHPPGHYLLSWLWAKLVGIWGTAFAGPLDDVESRLRLLSVVTGLTSIAVVIGAWRRWLGFWPSLATGLWLALSPAIVAQDREARMYPLLTLSLIVTVTTLAYLIESNKRRHAFALGAILAVSLYVHYLALFVLGGVALGLLATSQRHNILNRVVALGIPTVAFLPWLPVLIAQLRFGRANVNVRGPAEATFGIAFWEVIAVGDVVETGLFKYGVFPTFWILVTVGALAGVKSLSGSSGLRSQGSLAAALAIGGLWAFVLWYVSSIAIVNTSSLRYLGVFVPPLLGLVAIGFKALIGLAHERLNSRWPSLALTAVHVILIIFTSLGIGSGRLGYGEPWREVSQFLEDRVSEGETVLVNEYGRLMSLAYYYRPEHDVELFVPGANDFGHLADLSRTWIVVKLFGTPFLLQNESGGALDSYLNQRSNTVVDFGGGVLVISSQLDEMVRK